MKVPLHVTNAVFSLTEQMQDHEVIIFHKILKYKIIHNEKYDTF